MKEENGIIVNKYGAVDVKEIVEMQKDIEKIVELLKDTRTLLTKILRESSYDREIHEVYQRLYETNSDYLERISDYFIEDIKKLRKLTKADDYEFKTTTETTLVKKEVLKNEQL